MSVILGIMAAFVLVSAGIGLLGIAIGVWVDALNEMPWWQRRQKRKAEEEAREIARKLKEPPPPSIFKRNP